MIRYRGLFFDNERWNGFGLRAGDVVVTTPAKCGTTWTQTICAFLLRGSAELGAPLDEISPWFDSLLRPLAEVRNALEDQSGRRIIKTHTPLDGLPDVDGVTYVCVGRDLRDAFSSWDDHIANVEPSRLLAARSAAVGLDDLAELFPDGPPRFPDDRRDRFRAWIDAPLRTPSGAADLNLALALHHLHGVWMCRGDASVVLLHYDDLRADLAGVMADLARCLGTDTDPVTLGDLASAASFDRMRTRAADFAPETTSGIWRETEAFFRAARSGSWREEFEGSELDRYAERSRELAPPDLLDWIHRDAGRITGRPAD